MKQEMKNIPHRLERTTALFWLSGVLMLVGLASIPVLLAMDPRRFWNAYAASTLFWLGLAQGAIILSAAVRGLYALWGRHLLRFAEGAAAFLPVGYLFFLGLFIPREYYYYWARPDAVIHHPPGWMNFPGFVLRQAIPMLVLTLMLLVYVRLSLQQDWQKAAFRDDYLPSWLTRWIPRRSIPPTKLVNVGISSAIVFALVWSWVGFDMVMSMDRVWYSTMFGGYTFWSAFLAGVAFTVLITLWFRRELNLKDFVKKHNLQDMGRMLFAFSSFWMNLFWAQFLVIWYGKLPEETEFLYKRMAGEWKALGWTAFALIWAIPFVVLLPKKSKTTPWILGSMALSILAGLWLARFLEIVPTIWPSTTVPLGLFEVGLGLGMGGVFLLMYTLFMKQVPLIPEGDPELEAALHYHPH